MAFLSPLWPLHSEQPVVLPTHPPQKKQGKLKKSPIPYPKPVNKTGSSSPEKKGFRERPLVLSPLHLSMEPHSRAQLPLPGWALMICSPLVCPFPGIISSKQKVQSAFLLNVRAWGQQRVAQAGSGYQPQPAPPRYGASGWHALHPVRTLLLVGCV